MRELVSVKGHKIWVDDKDFERFSGKVLKISNEGYAYYITYRGRKGRKRVRKYLHILVGEPRKGYVIDHRDTVRTNNTRNNLREATYSQNARNRKKFTGVSKYKGVSPQGSKWRAVITFEYKKTNIGLFDTETHAAVAYDIWCKKLDPEHFRLNFTEIHEEEPEVRILLNDKDLFRPMRERKTESGKRAQYRGVKFLKDKNTFGAFITFKGKRTKLMTKKEPEEVALAYDSAARILYPDTCVLNFPNKDPIEHITEKAKQILQERGLV